MVKTVYGDSIYVLCECHFGVNSDTKAGNSAHRNVRKDNPPGSLYQPSLFIRFVHLFRSGFDKSVSVTHVG